MGLRPIAWIGMEVPIATKRIGSVWYKVYGCIRIL